MLQLSSVLVSAAVGGVTWVVATVIWRLYFSPLSRFPGPKLAAATLWYEFYYNVVKDGEIIWQIQKLHEQYGPIVRITPWELHINDPEFFADLYAGSRKLEKYNVSVRGAGSPESAFATIGHEQHRIRRGAINPFFSKQSIVAIEAVIREKTEDLSALFESHLASGLPVDFRDAYTALTLDIISGYCFGQSLELLHDPVEAEEWKAIMDAIFGMSGLVTHFPWIVDILTLLPDSLAGRLIRHQRVVLKHVKRILAEPLDERKQNTIFHSLRDGSLPASEKTATRLADEGNILIGAGGATTTYVLSVISYHLLANPQILKRLRVDLDAVLSSRETQVTWQQLQQIPYLVAIINEGLRIANPATGRLIRIDNEDEIRFQDWLVPRGTPVSMSTIALHHNKSIFPSPLTFNPERWLKAQDDTQPRLDRYLVPFGRGSRNCAGINLAQAELYLTVATVFRRFDFELFETTREADVDCARDHFAAAPPAGSKGIRAVVVGFRA